MPSVVDREEEIIIQGTPPKVWALCIERMTRNTEEVQKGRSEASYKDTMAHPVSELHLLTRYRKIQQNGWEVTHAVQREMEDLTHP